MAPAPVPSPPAVLGELGEVAEKLKTFTAVDWSGQSNQVVKEALVVLEQITRATAAIRSGALAEAETTKAWTADGQRTLSQWVSATTGASRSTAAREVNRSKSLHEDLPATRKALAQGTISSDHADAIARNCTKTNALRTRLSDTKRGEAYLVQQAEQLDATRFAKVAKAWAIETDPQGADRAWREESAQDDLSLTPTNDGYRLHGRFTAVKGALLAEALASHMGRKDASDTRTVNQRRAAALISLAHQSLDAGFQMPASRIRPHLTITMGYRTLKSLVEATGPSIPPAFSRGEAAGIDPAQVDPAQWARQWQPGDDHSISTTLNYDLLRGVPPATLSDGTPIPPVVLSRLACESQLTRVVFGPQSTILDAGRQKRIFSPSQTRAIIARDRHCQYPGCDEGPEFGEIHHSLEWYKHNGTTHVDLGLLLCWHHHGLVHDQGTTIHRISGRWIFTTRHGATIHPPGHSPPGPSYLDHLADLDPIPPASIPPTSTSLSNGVPGAPARSTRPPSRPKTQAPAPNAPPVRRTHTTRAEPLHADTLFSADPPF